MSTQADVAIRGGTVVDGTGRPAFRADIGVAGGRIVAIGPNVSGATEIDASDQLVVPGFIDVHTHYDPQVLWDPQLTPSCWHGVTSVIAGNCGFSIAPVKPAGRETLLRTLEKVEDMRFATMTEGIEWDFETYPEYLDAIDRRRPLINFGGYVGHTAVRTWVMGGDASDRPATAVELDAMRAIVGDSLLGGALGFSTDRVGFILGDGGKPVPSIAATQDEVEALMRMTAEVGRGIVHIAPGDNYSWLYDFQRSLGRTINWSAILAYAEGSTTRTSYRTKLADHAAGRAAGADVWAQVTCLPICQLVSLAEPAPYSLVPAFADVLAAPSDSRSGFYEDEDWRARAKSDLRASSLPPRWSDYSIAETDRHQALVGRSLQSIADETHREPFDVFCDLALQENLTTRFSVTFANDDLAAVEKLLLADGTIMGLSDAGAHVSQICDAVMPTDFLSHWVRDRAVMPLEQGVRKLSGELADVLGIDRGYLRVGAPADVVVIDYDKLDPGPVHRVHDMPAGGERLTADAPVGVQTILVNGVTIRADGVPLEAAPENRPGHVLRSQA